MTDRQLQTARALREALAGREPGLLEAPQARPAAVLMPLWDPGDQLLVVFTKRTEQLPTHAGQISFPGGARDPEDGDLEFTALRETCEEIGVCGRAVEVLARLDQVVTVTNYLVTPFIGLLEPGVEFSPNPVEVERLVLVPLAKVLDRASYRPTEVTWRGISFQQEALYHNGDLIWGATARILLNLLATLGPAAAEVAAAAAAAGPGGPHPKNVA